MAAIKVTSVDEALAIVRQKHPNARAEGSTFDWSFWVGDAVVAEMRTNRRSKEHSWNLVIFPQKEIDKNLAETEMFKRIVNKK